MLIHRRSLILGMGSLLAAPAIVRAQAIMPVKTMIWDGRIPVTVIEHHTNSMWDTHAIRFDETGGWKVWNPFRGAYQSLLNPYQFLRDGDQVYSFGNFIPKREMDLYHKIGIDPVLIGWREGEKREGEKDGGE